MCTRVLLVPPQDESCLRYIKCTFFTHKCISIRHLLDQGKLRSLKHYYHKQPVRNTVSGVDHSLLNYESLMSKRDEVTGEWRKLHNEELKGLYSSPNIVRVIKSRRMTGHVARMGEGRGVYRVLVGKPEGKRPLGRPRRRWEYNIRMDLQEVGLGYEDWIGLAQDRDRWRTLVRAVMNLRVP